MKKLFILVLIICLSAFLVALLSSCNETPEGSTLTFELVNDSYTVTGYTGSPTKVVIPATYNGTPVTSIGNGAFYSCDSLTSVTIPDSVTSIGESAFTYCFSLDKVYVSDIAKWCAISFSNYHSNPLHYVKKLYMVGSDTPIINLVIPEGVTSIGDYAFWGCDSLTSVTIPTSVTSIGESAFYNCNSLTSITIPNSVTSIGSFAFSDCSSLDKVYVSDIAKWCAISFGSSYANPLSYAKRLYMVGSDTPIINLVIPEGVTSVGDYAFYDCESLTSVTIPNCVTSIGSFAFSGCSSLASATIGNGVTSIGDSAFYHCESLTSITIPNSVSFIGKNLFFYCDSLTSVTMGSGVTSIGDSAFYSCDSLKEITIPNSVSSIGESAFHNCDSLTSVTITNSVSSIGNYAFCDCDSLTSVTIGSLVSSIGENSFRSCYKLVEIYNLSSLNITKGVSDHGCVGYYALNVYTPSSGESKLRTTSDGYIFYEDGNTVYLVGYTGNSTVLTLPDKYNGKNYEIYNHAFYNDDSITSVTIGSGVTSIGDSAFEYCDSLTGVTIGSGVTSIGDYAFRDCYNLVEIYNLSGLNITKGERKYGDVGYHALGIYTSTSTASKVYTTADGYIFYEDGNTVYLVGYTRNSTALTLPDKYNGKKYAINKNAFYGDDSITNVTIPNSVTSIGSFAFNGCTALTSVTIPDSVTGIGYWAFAYCRSLTSVTIGNGVTSIGYDAFYDCTALDKVYVSDIAKWCAISFSNYYSNPLHYVKKLYMVGSDTPIINLVIPEGVTSIGDYAFYDCESFTSVTIPTSVTSIDDYAFSSCTSLTSITIPNSVKTIGDYAFRHCDSLTSVTMGSGVTSIGEDAFYYCDSLNKVYISDIAKWCAISFSGSYSNPLYIARELYMVGSNTPITNLVVPEGVTTIPSYAFSSDAIASVTIPNSVTSIGENSFRSCYKLVEIYNLSSLNITKGSSNYGYVGYHALSIYTSTSIASKVHTTADGYIFYEDGNTVYLVGYTGNSTVLTLPDKYNGKNYAINKNAFYSDDSITNITIPNSVTSIGYDAFNGCTALTSVTIGNAVTSIGDHAFAYCDSLTSVMIGNGVTSIGKYAFAYCNSLTSATFKNTNGWWHTNSTTATSGTSISSTDLANTSTAAQYLSSSYVGYYWKRG